MSGIMYVPYHMHTMLSNGITNIDSVTDFQEYVDAAKKCGMPALGVSEHGWLPNWIKRKSQVEKAGMKYIHASEVYLTEDMTEKVRDNYHCVLIAKNYEGVKELNKLISVSFNRGDNHFYYSPRVTFDELFATSDNILVTTACLGGVLFSGTDSARDKYISFLAQNKDRCYLEVQHHNTRDQMRYNQYLCELSTGIDVPLIAATDTHALNTEHMRARSVLQKAKGVYFENEERWDMTFKTPEELYKAFDEQNGLSKRVYTDAMEETLRMANRIEEFTLDTSAKYPVLYDNSEEVFKQKINDGVKWRGIDKLPNRQEYYDRIHYEYDTYVHNGAVDFMLLEEDYKAEMRRQGVRYGYSRGSVSGSIIAYLLGITEIDSVKYNLNFERFMNKERVSLADQLGRAC